MCLVKDLMQHTTVKMGTFNLHGFNNEAKKKCLWQDMASYKVDVCCLQETKLTDEIDEDVDGCRFMDVGSESRYYGNGFAIAARWRDNVVRYWKDVKLDNDWR